jgi:hypothetical protein
MRFNVMGPHRVDTHATSLTSVNDAYSPSVQEAFSSLILLVMVVTIFFMSPTTRFTIAAYRREPAPRVPARCTTIICSQPREGQSGH